MRSVFRTSVLCRITTLALACLLGWMLLRGLGDNPPGLFADEAEIGLRTHELLTGALPGFPLPLFYEHILYSHLGALPLYATAPVVLVLGWSDMAVRLSSVIWSVAAVLALLGFVRQMQWRNGALAVALFAFSPVFIHISRINLGHAPSLFCVSAGLYAFVRFREQSSRLWGVAAGAALGISVYGNAAYYLATPVIVAGLLIGEWTVSRSASRAGRALAVFLGTLLIAWIPVSLKALTDDGFMGRFQEKSVSGGTLLSSERLQSMVENYPKYFSPRYLFMVGESGLPGGSIIRHTVPGAGLFAWIALPLVVLGIVAIFRLKDGGGKAMAVAGLVMFVLYPLPDLVTTSSLNPPYTFAVFPTTIFVPLLTGVGIHWASGWFRGRDALLWSSYVLPIGLLVVILGGAVGFFTGPYARYPDVGAGYYGWQYGPRQAIEALREHEGEYDRYHLDGHFNEAFVFLDFYLAEDPGFRANSAIGGLELVDLGQHDLYAIRSERYDAFMGSNDPLRRYVEVVDVVRYPNGAIALYLVDIGFENERPRGLPW